MPYIKVYHWFNPKQLIGINWKQSKSDWKHHLRVIFGYCGMSLELNLMCMTLVSLDDSPYLPDLISYDYFLSLKLKIPVKETY